MDDLIVSSKIEAGLETAEITLANRRMVLNALSKMNDKEEVKKFFLQYYTYTTKPRIEQVLDVQLKADESNGSITAMLSIARGWEAMKNFWKDHDHPEDLEKPDVTIMRSIPLDGVRVNNIICDYCVEFISIDERYFI